MGRPGGRRRGARDRRGARGCGRGLDRAGQAGRQLSSILIPSMKTFVPDPESFLDDEISQPSI